MPTYYPATLLPTDGPGPWSPPVTIRYDQRDALLYAVGIGCTDLRFVHERHPQFAMFPTFAIRWGGAGLQLDATALPPSPGPLTIDAERCLTLLAPLPLPATDAANAANAAVQVQVRSRLLAVHARGKGSALVEVESEVLDDSGQVCVRLVSGSFRRGVVTLGDISPFDGRGRSQSITLNVPARAPDVELTAHIASNQAQLYRLSGDYNPLHIDPDAARFGGFDAPILHGLCTYGHCGQLLLGAVCGGDAARFVALRVRFSSPVLPGDTLRLLGWFDGPGRLLFTARVGERTVVSNAYFEYR